MGVVNMTNDGHMNQPHVYYIIKDTRLT